MNAPRGRAVRRRPRGAWVPVGKAILAGYRQDDVSSLAGDMAYKCVLALFPFVIFLAALTGIIARVAGGGLFDITAIMNDLYGVLPKDSADQLRPILADVLTKQRGGVLSLGALLALWTASGAVATTIKAFNRAYGVAETRNVVVVRLTCVAFTLLAAALLIGGSALLLLGGKIGALDGALHGVWLVARVVLVVAGLTGALAVFHWKGPNRRQRFRFLSPGALLTVLVWILASLGFGLYVKLIGGGAYSKSYGALFGVVIFLLYLYLTNTVILLGAEFNAATAARDDAAIRDKSTAPGRRRPGEPATPHPGAAREAGAATVAGGLGATTPLETGRRSPGPGER